VRELALVRWSPYMPESPEYQQGLRKSVPVRPRVLSGGSARPPLLFVSLPLKGPSARTEHRLPPAAPNSFYIMSFLGKAL
jgi:hypothetical protein